MNVNSYRKSLIVGAVIGAIQIVLLTIFMAVVLYLTDGEGFFFKEGVKQQIGNICLEDIDKIGYIVSAIIPLIFLKYNSVKYLFPLMISSIFSYLITCDAMSAILFYIFSCNILGRLDLLHFGYWVFPFGALCGTILSVIINTSVNFHKKKKAIKRQVQIPD